MEELAAVLLVLNGVATFLVGLRLRAAAARAGDPMARSLSAVCLVGGVPAAVLLLAVHLMGGAMALMNAQHVSGRLAIGGCYLALGAGVLTTIAFVRTTYYPESRALVAVSVLVGGFFVLEAVVVPALGFSVPAVGLSLAHFPIQVAVYAWASFEGFSFAHQERLRPDCDAALARRHHLLGWAFVLPALWVVSSFVLIRHPQLMGLGASLGVASQGLVWRAFPKPAPQSAGMVAKRAPLRTA